MNKVKMWLISMLFKLQVGKWIAILFDKMKGWKTIIATICIVLIKMAIAMGYIPAEYKGLADEILNTLYGVGVVSFGDKVRRWWNALKVVADETIKQ